jgi:hypothetical protein
MPCGESIANKFLGSLIQPDTWLIVYPYSRFYEEPETVKTILKPNPDCFCPAFARYCDSPDNITCGPPNKTQLGCIPSVRIYDKSMGATSTVKEEGKFSCKAASQCLI